MKPVTIRNVTLGTGLPKICVPVVGKTLDDIRVQASQAASLHPDLVEWRGDWFINITSFEDIQKAFAILRNELNDIPLLYTFRTAAEGGERPLPLTEYASILSFIIQHRLADIIDIELALGNDFVSALIQEAHTSGIPVIVSNHDFDATPASEILMQRLHQMESLGCDIAKIAVMPQSSEDVIRLLSVTTEYSRIAGCPLITMSMSRIGLISRLCGNLTGSCLTFGSAGHASAPGQIAVSELRQFLTTLQ